MMKNVFYFTSKALFVLKIIKFLSWLFGHVAKRLDKKDKVNFKFYDKQSIWQTIFEQTIVTHILPNISRIKGNQTMKFGQLIKCNMIFKFQQIFLKSHTQNVIGKLAPDPFLKN